MAGDFRSANPILMDTLLTAGAACALGALLISLRIGERDRIRAAAALFVAMLGLLLAVLYPGAQLFFATLALVAAVAYAVLAIIVMRRRAARRRNGRD